VTAARSAYERRRLQLKSSYLARYKTWVQMCGVGVLMFINTFSTSTVNILLGIAAAAPVLAYFAARLATGRRWKGASAFAVSFAAVFAVHRLFGMHGLSLALTYFIVGITWVSGLGYLLEVGRLRGRGAMAASDLVRLVTSVALPILAVAARAQGSAPYWAVTALLSIELAHGGLDNLLAHHQAEAGALEWGARLVGECLLLVYAIGRPLGVTSAMAQTACAVAALAGLVSLCAAFVAKRRYYLEGPAKPRAGVPAVV
jgi:phosphatidylglycerophosphate synthase